MGRIYSVPFSAVAVSAAQDLWEILVPSDAVLILHSVIITQSSDAKDEEEELLRVTIKRITGSPTSGSNGSSATPTKRSSGDSAAGVTAEINNTTRLSGGTAEIIHDEAFNIRSGFYYIPTPEQRPEISPGNYLLVGLETAPGDALTMSGTLVFEELGG